MGHIPPVASHIMLMIWHINEIIEYSRSDKIEEYLKKYVSSLDSFQEYLDKIGKNSLTRVKPKTMN